MKTPSESRLAARLAPSAIEARSFAIIDAEIPEPRPFQGHAWELARRLIHCTGDTSLSNDLWLPDPAIAAGIRALRRGTTIFTDTHMACAGISKRRLELLDSHAECLLDQHGVMGHAIRQGITRSRAAMQLAAPRLRGAIIAIGNAPTSLLTLLEILDSLPGLNCAPALIIGMPVGFVNAAESKALLEQCPWASLTIRGRKGGSPLAAAAVNALMEIALRDNEQAQINELPRG